MVKARIYETDTGQKVYCSDIEDGVWCPHIGVFVGVEETCSRCLNHYKSEDSTFLYCLAPSDSSVTTKIEDEKNV